jgi:NAD(P)-dependent dehydrogenase (short-subunit alcohol dehydrogenase family)
MDLHLNGLAAVVTGASRGIGLAVTRGLVAEGVHVTAGAQKSSAELDELAGAGDDLGVMDYSAAKAALANFSKSLSKQVGPHGIRINTISPGPVATDLWLGDHGVAATVSRATGARPQDVQSQAAHQMVTGRFSRPDEVADLVLILASDRTANVTGADITIDGGLIPTW